ncbi:overlapping protein p62 [Dulcamara mottle virus]|uniref:Overlapping protein p62 n=1 Tax=Dulcamara mottle virus TaxID=70823 RepID=Q32WC8_9VIRU|nr:overlapping protein p62 [Dulcamara mottle virus]AAW65469.1 overlapping protein p62 [Dulcamara mottle virus]
MANGFSVSPRSTQLDHTSRCCVSSNSNFGRSTSPGFSGNLSMASSKRGSSFLEQPGDTGFILRDYAPPSPHPQNSGDFSPTPTLELPLCHSLHSPLHETLEVSKAPTEKPQFPGVKKLPAHVIRHRPVSHHLHHSSHNRVRLHARRSNVLPSQSNMRPLSEVSKHSETVLQLGDPTRVQLHGPFSPPRDLHLSDLRTNSSLRAGKSLIRFVQSTPQRTQLAKNSFYSQQSHYAQRHNIGLLGPPPLYLDTTGASLTAPCPCFSQHSFIQFGSLSPVPACAHSTCFVPNPGSSRVAFSFLSKPTFETSACPCSSVQLPLHLHKSGSHSPNFRSSRLCSHAKQQATVLLGNSKRLGQSSNFRSSKCQRPPKDQVSLPGQPAAKDSPLLKAALHADIQPVCAPHVRTSRSPKAAGLSHPSSNNLTLVHCRTQLHQKTTSLDRSISPSQSFSSHSSEEIFYSPKASHSGPGILGRAPSPVTPTSPPSGLQKRKPPTSKLEVHAESRSDPRSFARLPSSDPPHSGPVLPRSVPPQPPSPKISPPVGTDLLLSRRNSSISSPASGILQFSFFNSTTPSSASV